MIIDLRISKSLTAAGFHLVGVHDFGFGNDIVVCAIEQMYDTVEMPKSQVGIVLLQKQR